MRGLNKASYLGAIVIGLGYVAAANAAPVYFTETFDSIPVNTSAGQAGFSSYFVAPPDSRGGDRTVREDFGGSGLKTPDVRLFATSTTPVARFLNLNGNTLGLANAYQGSTEPYDVSFVATNRSAGPADPFAQGNSGTVIRLFLRQSALGARDGIQFDLYDAGSAYVTNGTLGGNGWYPGNFIDTAAPKVFDMKIRDDGSSLTFFVNGGQVAQQNFSSGTTNAGFIEFTTAGYNATKYDSISVTAVPEPGTLGVLAGVVSLMMLRRRSMA